MKTYDGMFIPHHKVTDAASKDQADQKLYNWSPESITAEEWIAKLDNGEIIQPSKFKPKDDGKYTHSEDYWVHTHFICADGDNFKGVEFDDDGNDTTPNGVDSWTEPGQLSIKYPELLTKAYAVGESISSMLKEPHHRRFRIIFLFDKPITCGKHYRQIHNQLTKMFPIIAKVDRAPSQPVYGNGREGFNVHICGNILNLDDYPMPEVEEKQQTTNLQQQNFSPNETLEEFLRRHHIQYTLGKHSGKYYVSCPYQNNHTGQKQGKKDSYVFDDGTGWAFYCSHAHCADKRTWTAFKEGNNITNRNGNAKRNYQPTTAEPEPPIEDQIEQSDEDEQMVKFPEDMFYGVFETYRDAIKGRTPIPNSFTFATVKHLISATLGRRIHIESQIPIFPNVYTGLIGESSDAHKGISLTLARQLIEIADPNIVLLTKTDTEEGLIDLFRVPELKEGENSEGAYEYYTGGISDLFTHERVDEIVNETDPKESTRIMGSFEELSSVMNRSKKATFSGIMERMMELYDMKPEIFVGTKHNKTRAEHPTFTMIGASAFELIEQSLAQHFITAGFTNRIEWYMSEETDPIFLYKTADPALWTETVEEIKKIRDSYLVGQTFTIEDKAYRLGDKWNKDFTEQRKQIDNILIAGSIKRMKMFILKNSLIFAALEHRGDFQINEQDILKAIQLCQYNCTVAEKLFGSFANTEHQKVCNRIVEILKKEPMQSAKKIQNSMRWADIREISLALQLMCEMNILGTSVPNRSIAYYVTKSD